MNQTMSEIERVGNEKLGAVKSGVERAVNGVKDAFNNREGVGPRQSGEGEITKQIEAVTTKVPSGTFLAGAFGAIGLSAALHCMGRKEDAQFVGQWVPTILLLGLYNKVVKLQGSE